VVFRGDGPSLLEAILAEAGERRTTHELQLRAKGGLVLAFGEPGLLRVAVGPARSKLETQERALAALAAREPAGEVADRVPWSQGSGRLGLGDWLLEAWLPGRAPHEGLSDDVFGECVDFLVSLFRSGHALATPTLEERGRALGVPELGARLDSELAQLPRGFAHGDFGLPNLLVEDDRLVGVVDWEAAGDGRLPLLDLFHLYVETRLRARQELGEGFVEHLLPWVLAGGEPWVARYLDALGLELDPRLLESLAVAWWLDVIGYAVESYDPASRWRRDWTARNVEGPVRALRAAGILGR
jgi:hypothetical protein